MVYLMIIAGVVCVLSIVFGSLSDDWKLGAIAIICSTMLFIGIPLLVTSRSEQAKAQQMITMGYKPYSQEQLYNMSQAEKDACYHFSTLNGSYYFPKEKSE